MRLSPVRRLFGLTTMALLTLAAPALAIPFRVTDQTFDLALFDTPTTTTASGSFVFLRDGVPVELSYELHATIESLEIVTDNANVTHRLMRYASAEIALALDGVPYTTLSSIFGQAHFSDWHNGFADTAGLAFSFEKFVLDQQLRDAFGLGPKGKTLTQYPQLYFEWTPGPPPEFPIVGDGRNTFDFVVPEPALSVLLPLGLLAARRRTKTR